jgi:hypothetical protein
MKLSHRQIGLIVITLVIVCFFVFVITEYKKCPTHLYRIEQKVSSVEIIDIGEYVLETKLYKDDELINETRDMGTFEEIDTLKCIRYIEIQKINNNLIYLNNKKCK